MALQLNPKAPSEVIRYGWAIPLVDGDVARSATLTVSSGTAVIDTQELSGDTVYAFISGGADGETAIFTATAVTNDGEELVETIYLPIRASANALSETARDICIAALRKVTGVAETPDSAELDDALERLSDMLAGWAAEGADLGIKLPCAANDIIYAPDWAIGAIKANLTARVFDLYGEQLPMTVALDAQRGLQRLKMRLLPADRDGADYY